MVTGAAVSLISTGAAMVDGFEDSMSPRKPSAPSMRSKCSISAWSWPTAPSSALPDMLLVPRLLWPCGDWRKGSVGQTQRERERERGHAWGGGRIGRSSWPIRRCSVYTLAANTERLLKAQEETEMSPSICSTACLPAATKSERDLLLLW